MEIHNMKWFRDRIGHPVRRLTKSTCRCDGCVAAEEVGFIITSKDHADYLHDIQGELGYRYSDVKELKWKEK